MKKIHITESQLKRLTEALTIDATKEVEAKGGNVSAAWNDMKTKNPSLDQQANDGEITVGVNPKGIDECDFVTKRQIKEAKIKKLQENSIVYKKKDLK